MSTYYREHTFCGECGRDATDDPVHDCQGDESTVTVSRKTLARAVYPAFDQRGVALRNNAAAALRVLLADGNKEAKRVS